MKLWTGFQKNAIDIDVSSISARCNRDRWFLTFLQNVSDSHLAIGLFAVNALSEKKMRPPLADEENFRPMVIRKREDVTDMRKFVSGGLEMEHYCDRVQNIGRLE